MSRGRNLQTEGSAKQRPEVREGQHLGPSGVRPQGAEGPGGPLEPAFLTSPTQVTSCWPGRGAEMRSCGRNWQRPLTG